MTYSEIKKYCLERLEEIRCINKMVNPWGFVCTASFIDLLAKLSQNKDSSRFLYISFIKNKLPEKYKNFKYTNGKSDLPKQMYFVLRCGILHSFSFSSSKDKAARDKSIIITHDGKDKDCSQYKHLSNYTENGMDAAVLIASDLCDDLETVINKMFNNKTVQINSEEWCKENPLIAALPKNNISIYQCNLNTNTSNLSA